MLRWVRDDNVTAFNAFFYSLSMTPSALDMNLCLFWTEIYIERKSKDFWSNSFFFPQQLKLLFHSLAVMFYSLHIVSNPKI